MSVTETMNVDWIKKHFNNPEYRQAVRGILGANQETVSPFQFALNLLDGKYNGALALPRMPWVDRKQFALTILGILADEKALATFAIKCANKIAGLITFKDHQKSDFRKIAQDAEKACGLVEQHSWFYIAPGTARSIIYWALEATHQATYYKIMEAGVEEFIIQNSIRLAREGMDRPPRPQNVCPVCGDTVEKQGIALVNPEVTVCDQCAGQHVTGWFQRTYPEEYTKRTNCSRSGEVFQWIGIYPTNPYCGGCGKRLKIITVKRGRTTIWTALHP